MLEQVRFYVALENFVIAYIEYHTDNRLSEVTQDSYDDLTDAYGILWEANNRQRNLQTALSSCKLYTDSAAWMTYGFVSPTIAN